MIKVVLFDLDDTLISEDEYIRSGYQYIAALIDKKYKLCKSHTYSELYELYCKGSKKVFNEFFDMHNISYTNDDVKYLVDKYRTHIPEIGFYDDVLPTLATIRKKKLKTGVISDGYLATQKNKAQVLNLFEIFDKVILTDELGKEYWKPHPKAFEIMKEFFNVDYEEMLYVADNPQKDFYIKKSLKIKTARIIRDKSVYKNAEYFDNVMEDYRIKKIDDILNIIE